MSLNSELIRFFIVAVIGLILDTSIALLLHYQFGILLTVASVTGFIIAAAINYVLHELWTFQDGHLKLSKQRALYYLGLLIITLIARVVAIEVLLFFYLSEKATLPILLIAAGFSFIVNFIISKLFVFKSPL